MTRRTWTPQDVAILRHRYPHERTSDVAAACGHTLKSTYAKASSLGLRKSAEFHKLPASGRWAPGSRPGWATRFRPGHKSWNTGISYQAGGRSAETQFKPGAYPAARWDQDAYGLGALRITTDGCLLINIGGQGRSAWAMLSRYVWWRETGRWPRRDEVVRAKNGDPYDCRIENLELLTRRENMLRNSVHNLPPEVAKLVQLRGQLVRRIREREERAA